MELSFRKPLAVGVFFLGLFATSAFADCNNAYYLCGYNGADGQIAEGSALGHQGSNSWENPRTMNCGTRPFPAVGCFPKYSKQELINSYCKGAEVYKVTDCDDDLNCTYTQVPVNEIFVVQSGGNNGCAGWPKNLYKKPASPNQLWVWDDSIPTAK